MFEAWQFKHDLVWLEVRGGYVSGKYGVLPNRCPKLEGDNVCSIQDHKPPFCRDYPGRREDCDMEWIKAFGCKYFDE